MPHGANQHEASMLRCLTIGSEARPKATTCHDDDVHLPNRDFCDSGCLLIWVGAMIKVLRNL